MRRPIVAGNWKMNLDLAAGRDLIASIRAEYATAEPVEVIVCPPAPYLFPAAKALDGCEIHLGAQDLYYTKNGAYTGEISAEMIAETGADFVIVGHSERRYTIGHLEDDRMVNLKLHAARRAELTPILCVGETLAERDEGRTLDVLTYQLTAALVGLKVAAPRDLVIAYEPVWAIGTGRNATPTQAQEAHAHLRAELERVAGGDAADKVRILYGGSVKPDNAGEIFAQPDVDGGLIGGASLKADMFVPIIKAAVAAAV